MLFDLYEGIEGKTLLLRSDSRDELVLLKQLFDDLAAGRLTSAELTDLFNSRSPHVVRVDLHRIERRHFDDPEVTSRTACYFHWEADPFDLHRYAGLVEALLDQHKGRYQLITSPQPQSITVEVTASPIP